MENKIRLVHAKKCLECLNDNNTREIYANITSAKDILVDFFMMNAVFPFDMFTSKYKSFPFANKEEQRVMATVIRTTLAASKTVFSMNAGSYEPIKFRKVNMVNYGLDSNPTTNSEKPPIVEKILLPTNSIKVDQSNNPPSTRDLENLDSLMRIEKTNEFLDQMALGKKLSTGKDILKIKLTKIIMIVPEFEKEHENLTFEKKKQLKRNDETKIEWTDYQPNFDLKFLSSDFSQQSFDIIVHEFGLQAFIMAQLFDFFQTNTDALRITTSSTKQTNNTSVTDKSDNPSVKGKFLFDLNGFYYIFYINTFYWLQT